MRRCILCINYLWNEREEGLESCITTECTYECFFTDIHLIVPCFAWDHNINIGVSEKAQETKVGPGIVSEDRVLGKYSSNISCLVSCVFIKTSSKPHIVVYSQHYWHGFLKESNCNYMYMCAGFWRRDWTVTIIATLYIMTLMEIHNIGFCHTGHSLIMFSQCPISCASETSQVLSPFSAISIWIFIYLSLLFPLQEDRLFFLCQAELCFAQKWPYGSRGATIACTIAWQQHIWAHSVCIYSKKTCSFQTQG